MSDLKRLVWERLVADVDPSASNPSLLTLANRSPWRVQAGALIGSTTVAAAASAGDSSVTVAATTNFRAPNGDGQLGDTLWLGGANGEAALIATNGIGTGTIALKAPLVHAHAIGDVVSALPTIITDQEPRTVIDEPSAYWRIVVGPYHEAPVPTLVQRSPIRLYEALLTVTIYDIGGSHALPEDVEDRLDWLLNLGDEGCSGNPSPVLGSASDRDWIMRLCLSPGGGEPHHDYSTLTSALPVQFAAQFERRFQ